MGESDFHAAMLAAFAFAALMGWPSFFAVDSQVVPTVLSGVYANTSSTGYVCLETELVDGETDFFVAMPAAFAFAALMGWPSCIVVDSPAVFAALSGGLLCFAALSEVLRRSWVPAGDAVLGCVFRWLRWVCFAAMSTLWRTLGSSFCWRCCR